MYASPILVRRVVEECAELSAGQLSGGIGHCLQQGLKIQLRCQSSARPVEDFQDAGFLAQGFLRAFVRGDVAKTPHPADFAAVDNLGLGEALEGPAVLQFENIEALGWRVDVDLRPRRRETRAGSANCSAINSRTP